MNKTNWREAFEELVRKGEFSYYPGEGLKELNRENLFNFIESLLQEQKAELRDKVSGMSCDLCGEENKMWDNKLEKMIPCDGFKHKVLSLINKEKK
jgi:hypothetical protein